MRKISFFTLIAAVAIWNLTSCAGSASGSSGVDSVDTSQQVEPVSVASTVDEFLGGRTPWEEFYIDSKEYGYANVRETPSKDSPVVKEIQTGEHFYGWRMEDDPDWIEVYDNDGRTIGYMWYTCARHTGNKSDEGENIAENYDEEPEEDIELEGGEQTNQYSEIGNNQNSEIEEIKSWIQGSWYYSTTIFGNRYTSVITITGDNISAKTNGEIDYSGPYNIDLDYEGLKYNNRTGKHDIIVKYSRIQYGDIYIIIDKERRQLKVDENNYYQRL